jgi:hypothetical protein
MVCLTNGFFCMYIVGAVALVRTGGFSIYKNGEALISAISGSAGAETCTPIGFGRSWLVVPKVTG